MMTPVNAYTSSDACVEELKHCITSIEELEGMGFHFTAEEKEGLQEIIQSHPMRISRYYLSLIHKDDPHDPLRKQCIPQLNEILTNSHSDNGIEKNFGDEKILVSDSGITMADPYGEDTSFKGNGIFHKYSETVFVICSISCGVFCRHCYRKRFVGMHNDWVVQDLRKAADYVRKHPEITNVWLTGGDPLIQPTPRIKAILDQFKDIEHIEYMRIGTRSPVTFPIRINCDDELIDVFREFNESLPLYFMTHFNHAREFTSESILACKRLHSTGALLSNQSVLLRGVNDTHQSLRSLSLAMVRNKVLPYYLYQCMPVHRIRQHFLVPLNEGIDLVDKVKRDLDGHAKRFRYVILHDSGEIEVIGKTEDRKHVILKQLNDRNKEGVNKIFIKKIPETGCLEDITL